MSCRAPFEYSGSAHTIPGRESVGVTETPARQTAKVTNLRRHARRLRAKTTRFRLPVIKLFRS
eukprot:scaffold52170_cov63-Phaeocystis_antarctica.AAC.10